MEPETINSTELRTKTRDLMERVKYNGEIFLVETFGRPMAVIISFEDFNRVRELLGLEVKPPFSPLSTTEDGNRKQTMHQKAKSPPRRESRNT